MELEITRFSERDIGVVFEIQQAAYKPLYEKYHDAGSNPYMENKETVLRKYIREGTTGYLFLLDGKAVGAVRISIDSVNKSGRISALCVLPEYQGKGIAQKALTEIERMHPDVQRWRLDTIEEEAGNCHLYEKIGYRRTGETKVINEKMTLIFYEKEQTGRGR